MNANDTHCGKYAFNFSSSGLFTLINKKGESLYEECRPLFEKTLSHLIWIFFWVILILFSRLLVPPLLLYTIDRTLMTFIFLHLFFFGCRLTTLLLSGGLFPLLFPPLWVKLTRDLHKGAGMELLKKYNLDTNPGLLGNLALMQHMRGECEAAHKTIRIALTYSNHPTLSQLSEILLTHFPQASNFDASYTHSPYATLVNVSELHCDQRRSRSSDLPCG